MSALSQCGIPQVHPTVARQGLIIPFLKAERQVSHLWHLLISQVMVRSSVLSLVNRSAVDVGVDIMR